MVFDTSALIAMVKDEAGADVVLAHLDDAVISTVNLVETLGWIRRNSPGSEGGIVGANLPVLSFGSAEAAIAIRLLAAHHGTLSLGDCACLATAELHRLPVLTADRIWATLDLPIEVRLIR